MSYTLLYASILSNQQRPFHHRLQSLTLHIFRSILLSRVAYTMHHSSRLDVARQTQKHECALHHHLPSRTTNLIGATWEARFHEVILKLGLEMSKNLASDNSRNASLGAPMVPWDILGAFFANLHALLFVFPRRFSYWCVRSAPLDGRSLGQAPVCWRLLLIPSRLCLLLLVFWECFVTYQIYKNMDRYPPWDPPLACVNAGAVDSSCTHTAPRRVGPHHVDV